MKFLKSYIIIFCCVIGFLLYPNNSLHSQQNEAYHTLNKLDSLAEKAFKTDSISVQIALYFEALDVLPKVDSLPYQAEFLFNMAQRFKHIGLYNEASLLYKQQLEIEHNLSTYSYRAFLAYGDLAEIQIQLGKPNQATKTYLESISISKRLIEYQEYYAAGLNNLGIHYHTQLKKLDSAAYYYTQAAEWVALTDDEVRRALYGSIRDNIALLYMAQQKYAAAEAIFYDNFYHVFPNLKQEKERYFRAGIQLADSYLKQKKYAKTKLLLDNIAQQLKLASHPKKPLNLLQFYKVKRHWHITNKEYKMALETSNTLEKINDSINKVASKKTNINRFLLADFKNQSYENALALETLKKTHLKQQANTKTWGLILLSCIILIFLLGLYLRARQRAEITLKSKQLTELNLEQAHLKAQLLESKIIAHKKDISNVALASAINAEWVEALRKKIQTILSKVPNKKQLKELDQFVLKKQHSSQTADFLKQRINQINTTFYNNLLQAHSNLTDYDLRLCAFLSVALTTKEIAVFLNISPESVNKSRYRLRKKLGLAKTQSLKQYLKQF